MSYDETDFQIFTLFTDPDNWSKEKLMELLCRDMPNEEHVNAYCHISPSALVIKPEDVRSTLGDLESLPREILHKMLEELSFASIEIFSRTCRAARLLVDKVIAYRELIRFIPKILTIFSDTKLMQYHSVADVRQELHFRYCRSCGDVGTYLFLPTCERVCLTCLNFNQAYWCLPQSQVSQAFALPDNVVETLPVQIISQSSYRSTEEWPELDTTQYQLVAVKSALQLAINWHGSQAKVQEEGNLISPDKFADSSATECEEGALFRYLREAKLGPLAHNPSLDPPPTPTLVHHEFHGLASIWIPFMPHRGAIPEKLYFCGGCQNIVKRFDPNISDRVLGQMDIDPGMPFQEIRRRLLGKAWKARTWDEMVEHIRSECSGGRGMMFEEKIAAFGAVAG